MDTSRFSEYMQSGKALAISLAIAVVSALALWIVGRWIIGFVTRLIGCGIAEHRPGNLNSWLLRCADHQPRGA